jgi:hypothetical protein
MIYFHMLRFFFWRVYIYTFLTVVIFIFLNKSILYFYTFVLVNVAEQMAELRKINITTVKKVYIYTLQKKKRNTILETNP